MKELLNKLVVKRNAELDEIKARLDALEKINETSEDEEELKAASEEIDALKVKKEELEKELAEVNQQLAEMEKPVEETPQRKLNFMKKEERGMNKMNIEERKAKAEEFVKTRRATFGTEETRSVLVASGSIATPVGVDGINDGGFVKVSSILDLVKVENCEGMGSNRVAYQDTDAVATKQTEGSAAGTSDPSFKFVTITPESYAVLSSISKQAKKQSPLQYEAKVKESAMIGLRKAASKLVIDKVLASTLVEAKTVAALDQAAIRNIALSYGGDEGIEGGAWLILNKADLVTLGAVRGTNEKKAVFEITPNQSNANTGVIKDGGLAINYCLNNNLTAGTLLYGNPKNIELDLFSNYEIAVSEDFYFDKLMDAIRGDVEIGCDVVAKNGIVKITVGA